MVRKKLYRDGWLIHKQPATTGVKGMARLVETTTIDGQLSVRCTNAKLRSKSREGKQNMTKNYFQMEHATVIDTGLSHQVTQQFIAQNEASDILVDKVEIVVAKTVKLPEIVAKIKAHMSNSRAVMTDHTTVYITGEYQLSPALVILNNTNRSDEYEEVHQLSAVLATEPSALINLKANIEGDFSKHKLAKVKWWFAGHHGSDSRTIFLPPHKTVLHPEFYPDLGDPEQFMTDYLNSEASVLLLAGPPGTGKTTLLRHLVVDRKLAAHVIYDEKLMEKDSIFQSFLFDEDGDIMVIEDADTILSDRDRDGNKMMSRFLSVSDGLIKLPNKKLVFTTNITDYGRVDEALLRPGRCFRMVQMRALDLMEAQAAAKVAGLPIPIEKRQYTLAELFNQASTGAKHRAVGFGVRG